MGFHFKNRFGARASVGKTMKFKTLDDADFEGKKVLLRADLNAPVEEGEIKDCLRFKRHKKTIKELSDEGAKVVVLAHQGRPSQDDFKKLEEHSKILSKHLDKKVHYLDEFFSSHALRTVNEMEDGDVMLLENVRFLSEELKGLSPEEHAKSVFVQTLSEEFDLYVNDAFSAAHRSHASLVGFTPVLDSYGGRVMEEEVEALEEVSEKMKYPEVLVLGGEKPEDIIEVIRNLAPRKEVSKILLGGVIGEIALIAMNYEIGEKEGWLKEKGYLEYVDDMKELIRSYRNKIEAPHDLAYDKNGERKVFSVHNAPERGLSYDIGSKTIEKYKEFMSDAREILVKGPMGKFEKNGFEKGSEEILKEVSNSDAFTVLGGGHTSSLVKRFDLSLEDFSHVSIAGGALIRFISGEELPALEALKKKKR